MSDRFRWITWVLSLATILVTGFLWSQQTLITENAQLRMVYWGVIWLAMFGMVFAFPKLNSRGGLILMAIAVVIVRLSFWAAPESNDVNRFLWEGRLLWMGENPYETFADDERWVDLRDDYWQAMNNRHLKTAYPPGMELAMAGASYIWYHPLVFKVLALFGDLWTIAILILVMRDFNKPLHWLGFYAFNPLILVSFAVESHFDSLMVAPMVTALWLGHRQSWRWAWLWLGVAVQMKLMALVLAPIFLLYSERQHIVNFLSQPSIAILLNLFRETCVRIWPFFIVLILPCLVFWEHIGGMVSGLFVFGSKGAFNGGLYELCQVIGLKEELTRLLILALFVLSYSLICVRVLMTKKLNLFEVAFWALLVLLITSPIVHFWYLSWVLWFLVLRPSPGLLLLCGTMLVYFLTWHNLAAGIGWGYPKWVVVFVTWMPFFFVFCWENRNHVSSLWQRSPAL